jgi:hypothetical protein
MFVLDRREMLVQATEVAERTALRQRMATEVSELLRAQQARLESAISILTLREHSTAGRFRCSMGASCRTGASAENKLFDVPSSRLSANDYVSKLRAGETADVEELQHLRGRLCRGRDPGHFRMLGYGSTCFVLGGDGLKLFLDAAASSMEGDQGGAPLEMLLRIGYDILDIYRKLIEGWVFDLVVWDIRELDPPLATWDGVASVLDQLSPVVAEQMRLHMDTLVRCGSGVLSPQEYASLQQDFKPNQPAYTFKGDLERLSLTEFEALVRDKQCSAAAVRKHLYDCYGLNDLYAGHGYTVLANGDRGICEYLAVNRPRGSIEHGATAIGAPTLEQCLQRISAMYEELNAKVAGVRDFHLGRWVSCDEVPSKHGSGRPVRLSPKQFVDMLRKGETLPQDHCLEGLYLRFPAGPDPQYFGSSGGPLSWRRETHLIGPPEQLQRWLKIAASPQQSAAIDCFLDISYSITMLYHMVRRGDGNLLMVLRGEEDGPRPDIFPCTFEGITRLCERLYPDVVEPLKLHRDSVLAPMDEAEYKLRIATWESDRMTYERFQRSDRTARDVRFFIDHGLGLRGGWNGSGYERQFIGGGITPMLLAINRDFTQLASDEFDHINFGAPSLDKVVSLMCDGLAELSAKAKLMKEE